MRKLIISFVLISFYLLTSNFAYSQNTRPVRDDVGFCWDADQMERFINWLNENSDNQLVDADNLVAGISPHDDYLYAGKIYYPLYKLIKTKEVVIFGVTHGTVRKEINDPRGIIILDEFNKWKGSFSDVEISPLREVIKQRLDKSQYIVSNKAHSLEHSIEALIPFLQYYNRDVKITPIMITAMSFERMDSLSTSIAGIISDYMKQNKLKPGNDIFFLFSNDANHYGEDFNNQPYGMDENAHRTATENDKRIAVESFNGTLTEDKIINLSNELWPETGVNSNCPLWCGRYSVVFGLLTLEKLMSYNGNKITGKVLKYSDTFTEGVLPFRGSLMGTTAPFSLKHWCGFLSAGFYLR